MAFQESGLHPANLQLNGLATSEPALLLKLNQGHTLGLLKRCAQAGLGSPTVTFHKDHAVVSIPSTEGTAQETHFRIAQETLPNLLLHHDSSGWFGVGYVTNKLHPKEWAKASSSTVVADNSTNILSMSQEVQHRKKTAAAARAIKKTSPDLTSRPVPQKGPSKSVAKVPGKASSSARKRIESDSDSSDSDEESDDDEDEAQLAAISRRRGKRPSSSDHTDSPVPLKKPRATEIPVPNGQSSDEEDADTRDRLASHPTVASKTARSQQSSSSSSSNHTPSAAMTAGKRPRSTSPTERSPNTISPISTVSVPHLHEIELITIPSEIFPATKDLHTFEEFEHCYKRYKEIWPRYIRLHGELMKNKADFETLQATMQQMEQNGEDASEIARDLQLLHERRQPIVDPMRITYTKLHTAMQMARAQLESYSAKHLPSNGHS
jgi:hypothetical protein